MWELGGLGEGVSPAVGGRGRRPTASAAPVCVTERSSGRGDGWWAAAVDAMLGGATRRAPDRPGCLSTAARHAAVIAGQGEVGRMDSHRERAHHAAAGPPRRACRAARCSTPPWCGRPPPPAPPTMLHGRPRQGRGRGSLGGCLVDTYVTPRAGGRGAGKQALDLVTGHSSTERRAVLSRSPRAERVHGRLADDGEETWSWRWLTKALPECTVQYIQ